ncbi:MAG: 2-C-methyl-D-erythritol 4-phosphate cytidylyltransferase [Tepidisphaeraceae bacterium]|jgi:2-C-methyl-D-erythritol 4-phosphate cytidylyltransferase
MASFSVVIVTAVPSGLGADGAGGFVKIDGRECLLRAVEMFLNRDGVKQIQLVVADDQFEEAKRKFGGHLSFSGAKLVVAGKQWMDQLAAVADKISADATHVIIHDAARPAVAYNDLDALAAEAEKHPIVVMTTSVRGGVIETEESGKPIALRSGQRFQQVVTPWVFRKDKFLEMAKNRRDPAAGEMWLLRSSPLNVRLSQAADVSMVKAMISLLPKPRIKASDNPFEEAQW